MYWEGNDLNVDSKITYAELLSMVCRIANYLKSIGIKKGDDVTIYMPMVVELPAAMVRTQTQYLPANYESQPCSICSVGSIASKSVSGHLICVTKRMC